MIILLILILILATSCATNPDYEHPAPADTQTRERAVNIAEKYLGMPYKWGGQSWCDDPNGSIDCSGLVINVYKEAIPQNARLPFDDTTATMLASSYTTPVRNPARGDLIFMGDSDAITHVAICIGSDIDTYYFIDAYSVDGCVEKRSYRKQNPKIISFGRMLVLER